MKKCSICKERLPYKRFSIDNSVRDGFNCRCKRCDSRYRRELARLPAKRKCSIDNCNKDHRARGYCAMHYCRWQAHGDPYKVTFVKTPRGPKCIVPDCSNKVRAKNLCEKHYCRWKKYGDTNERLIPSGPDSSNWKGGRHISKEGYVRISVPRGGYKLEHRLVMERKLGRQLLPTETVHHVNGNRADNRLSNLQLRKNAHGPGVSMKCYDCGSHNVHPAKLRGK